MISTIYSHRNFFELPDVRKNFVALVGLKSPKHSNSTRLYTCGLELCSSLHKFLCTTLRSHNCGCFLTAKIEFKYERINRYRNKLLQWYDPFNFLLSSDSKWSTDLFNIFKGDYKLPCFNLFCNCTCLGVVFDTMNKNLTS